ncbi:hypothetical protein [Kitasatospora sp. NPDC008115]|uniref:hypothetical protein n=1 Tax=Kitasatospora sp. NPDC008115 TaxID=3364022 RepID=UPI0036EDF262
MPKYNPVSTERQLPGQAPGKTNEVAITTTIPYALRRQLTLALAVHDVKLKDAVAQALEAWLESHPVSLGDPGSKGASKQAS